MKFRTEIEIPQATTPLNYSSMILSLGSCFALSIGQKLSDAKFRTIINPTGVLFNPSSIISTLQRFASSKHVTHNELQQSHDRWFHFDFHGSLSSTTAEETLNKINTAVDLGHKALMECDTIIITLGTAWVYSLKDNNEVVANCHKEPASRFVRQRLSVEQITTALGEIVQQYPEKQFIFSVSPIRHLADGLTENSLSKATLRVAIAQIVELYDNVCYFPSYEILLDDLRDYRFYADDMLHPSPLAIEYIWSKFCSSHISQEALKTMESLLSIVRAASHRPLNPSSSAHRAFCEKQLQLIAQYPNLDFGKESAHFEAQLQNNL